MAVEQRTASSASSTIYLNAVPCATISTGVPPVISYSAWFTCSATAVQTYHTPFSLFDNTSSNTIEITCAKGTASRFGIGADDGGGSIATEPGTYAANEWCFVIGRIITSSNRRCSCYNANTQQLVHGNNTSAASPDFSTTQVWRFMGRGTVASESMRLAEFWIMDGDLGVASADLDASLVYQLAMYGPWSVPRVAQNLIAHLPFYNFFMHDNQDSGNGSVRYSQSNENYFNQQKIKAANTVGTIGFDLVDSRNKSYSSSPHPPVSPQYIRPGQGILTLPY